MLLFSISNIHILGNVVMLQMPTFVGLNRHEKNNSIEARSCIWNGLNVIQLSVLFFVSFLVVSLPSPKWPITTTRNSCCRLFSFFFLTQASQNSTMKLLTIECVMSVIAFAIPGKKIKIKISSLQHAALQSQVGSYPILSPGLRLCP